MVAMVVATKNNLENLPNSIEYLKNLGFKKFNILFDYLVDWQDEDLVPLKKEYDRTYDRLFKRKSNGLDYSEWLKQMTLAMDIKERGESGEISLDEAIRLLKEI